MIELYGTLKQLLACWLHTASTYFTFESKYDTARESDPTVIRTRVNKKWTIDGVWVHFPAHATNCWVHTKDATRFDEWLTAHREWLEDTRMYRFENGQEVCDRAATKEYRRLMHGLAPEPVTVRKRPVK